MMGTKVTDLGFFVLGRHAEHAQLVYLYTTRAAKIKSRGAEKGYTYIMQYNMLCPISSLPCLDVYAMAQPILKFYPSRVLLATSRSIRIGHHSWLTTA